MSTRTYDGAPQLKERSPAATDGREEEGSTAEATIPKLPQNKGYPISKSPHMQKQMN